MKQSLRFLSMLFVMMVTALTAWADDWTVNISPVELKPGDTVYVQNVGTGRYIGGGEAWSTQAVVNPLASAAKCIIVKLDDGTYQIKNDAAGWLRNETNENIIYRQPNDGTLGKGIKGCYVDYSTAWNEAASKWAIANVGNNVYTFQVPNLEAYQLTEESTSEDSLKGYIAGEYLGVNRTHKSEAKGDGITWGLYYDVVYADSAANCQFVFLPVAITNAKAKLLQAVENASSAGLDVTAAAALLADAEASVEAVTAEANRLSEEVEQAATPTNPQNLTDKYISNPTPIKTGTPTDWTVVNMDGSSASTGSSSDGLGEFWNARGVSLKYTIHQLPAGVYRFTAIALTRTGMYGKFFVNNDSVNVATVSSDKVNSRAGAAEWFTQDDDNDGVLNGTNVISLVLPEAADVTIGLMSDTLTSDYWMVWREFKLESLGTGVESFQYVSKDLLTQIQAIQDDDKAEYTASIMEDALSYANAGINATSKEEAAQNYMKAKAFYDDLKLNIVAWKTLADVADDALNESYQLAYGENVQLVCEEAVMMMDERTASTDEVNAMIQKIKDALDEARKSSYMAGDDVTNLIKNPTFNDETVAPSKDQPQSKEGWTGATFGSGGTKDLRLCEQWASDFNTYQDIKGLQPGAYKLSIQAYMRPSTAADSWTAWKAGNKEVPAWIYIGQTEQRIHNICDFTWSSAQDDATDDWVTLEDGVVIPNTMSTSYTVMSADADVYNNSVVGLVTEQGGTMRIGIKAQDPNATAHRWVIFHDFTMTYLGSDVEYVKPVLDAKIAELKAITDPMSANEKAILDAALATADEATAGSDGIAMLKAYAGLTSVVDTVNASINAYKALQSSLDSLTNMSQDGASDEAIQNANNLIDEVKAAITDGSIAILDVPAKQAEMEKARKALMMKEGSDDAPADYTAWIVNPTFENGFTGWTVNKTQGNNPTASDNCAEIWNASADVYQEITGLPEGTYQVKLKGYFRQIGARRAWLELIGDSVQDISRAKIYANWEVIKPNNWATREYKDQFSATGTGWYEAVDSTNIDSLRYFLPDTRANARIMFDANAYQLSGFTYVNESGLLRIGFADDVYTSADWFVTTDWELYYYGKNSSHSTETGINDPANGENVKFDEIYSVDGRRMGVLQKGVNILRGKTADGKLVTKKVVLK